MGIPSTQSKTDLRGRYQSIWNTPRHLLKRIAKTAVSTLVPADLSTLDFDNKLVSPENLNVLVLSIERGHGDTLTPVITRWGVDASAKDGVIELGGADRFIGRYELVDRYALDGTPPAFLEVASDMLSTMKHVADLRHRIEVVLQKRNRGAQMPEDRATLDEACAAQRKVVSERPFVPGLRVAVAVDADGRNSPLDTLQECKPFRKWVWSTLMHQDGLVERTGDTAKLTAAGMQDMLSKHGGNIDKAWDNLISVYGFRPVEAAIGDAYMASDETYYALVPAFAVPVSLRAPWAWIDIAHLCGCDLVNHRDYRRGSPTEIHFPDRACMSVWNVGDDRSGLVFGLDRVTADFLSEPLRIAPDTMPEQAAKADSSMADLPSAG